jgi:hypothetical protein
MGRPTGATPGMRLSWLEPLSPDQRKRISRMVLLLLAAAWPPSALCQQTAQPRDADRLGLTCAQILKMSSTEWITYFGAKTNLDSSSRLRRASAIYGKCYEARTDGLAASLGKTGQAPPRAARADFAEFEASLKSFTTKALADAQGPADPQKQVLAALYARQFRYEFYQRYAPKIVKPGPAEKLGAGSRSAAGETKSRAAVSSESTSEDADEMTKAKNLFGELLGALPDDKLHELHAAFGEVVGLHALTNAMRLAVYRYAIFLLQPSSEESSYPPPF